jgi:MFS transporter, DHA1 family, multidrug resistance protein
MGFGQGMVVPTLPDLATAFEVPAGLAAQAVTAQLAGRTAFLLPAGFIVDRFGRKHAMVIGPILVVVGALVTIWTPWFGGVLAGQALTGAGDSLWGFGREVAAVDQIRPEQRARVMSAFFGLWSVGIAFGPVVGGVLTGQLGFRVVFLVYGIVALAVLVLALSVVDNRGRRPPLRVPPGLARLGDVDPYYRTTFLVLLFSTFSAMLRTSTVHSMLPIYVVTYLGYTTADVGYVFGIVGLVTLLMIGPAGFISDRIGRKAATVPAAALAGVSFLGYFFARDLLELSLASVVLGISAGFATGAMTTFTYDIIPEEGRGRFQALRRSVGEIGSFSGPLLGAVVAGAYQPGAAFLVFAPLHLASALLLAFVARESLATRTARPRSV